MSVEITKAQAILAANYDRPFGNDQYIRYHLEGYHSGNDKISTKKHSLFNVYWALQTMLCAGLPRRRQLRTHRNSVKRDQRSDGKKLRKLRTGSRRG